MNVSQSIVSIPFHGDFLDAVKTEDGKIWVSVRRGVRVARVRRYEAT